MDLVQISRGSLRVSKKFLVVMKFSILSELSSVSSGI